MRGCLILVSPLDPATGTRIDVRAGASMNSRTLNANGETWRPAIMRMPVISADFFDMDYKGTVQFASAQLVLNTKALGLKREYLTTLIWDGAPIQIWSGDGQSTVDLNLEFTGNATGVVDRTSWLLPLRCDVNKRLIDVPLLTEEYDGGGDAGGDPEVRGQLKPACFGKPVNVPVLFFDQINWIGQVDGYGNVTAIDYLYENAASFGPKVADYPSFVDLRAAALAEGTWATCVAEGLIRLGADPKGIITADPICGAGTPGTMLTRWVTVHAGVSAPNINAASFTALDDGLAGVLTHEPAVSYYTQSQVNTLDRIQALCAACNATFFIGPDGKLAVSRAINNDPPSFTLRRTGSRNPAVTEWRSLDQPKPFWRLKAEAAKTWRVHELNEIDYEDDLVDRGDYDSLEEYRQGNVIRWTDGNYYLYINATPSTGNDPPDATYWALFEDAVDATLRYSDGTPIDDLRPAEPGADVTRYITDPPQRLTFNYDYDGTPAAGEFPPRIFTFKLMNDAGQIATGITWTYAIQTGTANGLTSAAGPQAMTGAGTGELSIASLGSSEVKILVNAHFAGQDYSKGLTLSQNVAAPPVSTGTTGGGGGGGGGTDVTTIASITSLTSFSSTTFATVGSLTGQIPAGKTSAGIVVQNYDTPVHTGSSGGWTVETRVMRDNGGGSLTQIGSTESADSQWIAADFSGDEAYFNFGVVDDNGGAGLTPGNTYSWLIQKRLVAGTKLHGCHANPAISVTA